jgi:NCS1 family nucleobase:cation symporter-1
MPVMFIHPTVLRHLFVVKAIYTTIALFGVLGWVISANGGSIGEFKYTTKQSQLSGSDLVWPMIQAINSVMGALAPVLINQPDIARYGHSYNDVTWSQGVGILISKVLVMFLSTATTAAATQVLGKSYWNVWDLYNAILDQYWTAGARAGMVFASFGMMLAVLVTNAGSNSLPVGADLTGIFPRWLTIVRGQVICAVLAPLLVPWKIRNIFLDIPRVVHCIPHAHLCVYDHRLLGHQEGKLPRPLAVCL